MKEFCIKSEGGKHFVCELLPDGKVGKRLATYLTPLESWQDLQRRKQRAEAYGAEIAIVPGGDDAKNFQAAIKLIQTESAFSNYAAAYAEAKRRYPGLYKAFLKSRENHKLKD